MVGLGSEPLVTDAVSLKLATEDTVHTVAHKSTFFRFILLLKL